MPDPTLRAVAARPGDREHQHELDKATELLTRLDIGHPVTLDRMRSAIAGQPGAANLDSGGSFGMSTRRFCFTHETDRDHTWPISDIPCEEWSQVPARSDPTGEAAAQGDRAASDLKSYEKARRDVVNAVHRMAAYAEPYHSHAASEKDQREVAAMNVEPGCQNCAKVDDARGEPWWSEVYRTGTVNGNLEVEMRLCSWDYTWVRDTGRLAYVGEVSAHLRGEKVMRPAESVLKARKGKAA